MEKKKVILTLCKSFPVTHSKAGEATDFEKKLKDKSKIHTIRYNAKNVWNERYKDIVSGKKYLSIREWTGRPYNSEQKEIAQALRKVWAYLDGGVMVDVDKLAILLDKTESLSNAMKQYKKLSK